VAETSKGIEVDFDSTADRRSGQVQASRSASVGTPAAGSSIKHMRWIEGGTFLMGSENFYPEERPVHRVRVDGFWIDEHPVTVAEFRRFIKATGYVTVAERPLDAAKYPDADPDLLVPGALVFQKASAPVDLGDYRNWWRYVPGARWTGDSAVRMMGERPACSRATTSSRDSSWILPRARDSGASWVDSSLLLPFGIGRPGSFMRCSGPIPEESASEGES
jgi:formylglycine-generating enzyme required for sulfatase activity